MKGSWKRRPLQRGDSGEFAFRASANPPPPAGANPLRKALFNRRMAGRDYVAVGPRPDINEAAR